MQEAQRQTHREKGREGKPGRWPSHVLMHREEGSRPDPLTACPGACGDDSLYNRAGFYDSGLVKVVQVGRPRVTAGVSR